MFVRLDGQKVVPIECQREWPRLGIAATHRSCSAVAIKRHRGGVEFSKTDHPATWGGLMF